MLEAQQIFQQRYQLKQKLAQNAGRQTWLAEDISIQPAETVILKFLAFGEQFQWQDLKLFEREADILKQLSHPRIPKYRDYFSIEDKNSWFALVQEHIPGSSLKQLIESKQRFTEEELRRIATDVLEILCYLHTLNPQVIHRDIKPSNLMLGGDKKVYLIDFGAVQDNAAAKGTTFTIVGTYGYAPIEQFGGRTVPASDLYALGATLIHLATGIIPADLPQNNMRIQFEDKVSLSDGFIHWIKKLTEPNINDRYSSASLALNSLTTGIVVNSSSHISKPHASRIELDKSEDRLEIKIPSRKNVLWLITAILLIPLDIIIFLFAIAAIFSQSIPVLFFCILFFAIRLIIINMSAGCYIQFDRNKFEIEWKLFGFTYRKKIGKTLAIHNVALKTTHMSANNEPFEKISIEAGAKKYDFAALSPQLVDIEKAWLVQEINDWLGISQLPENKQKQDEDALKILPPVMRNWIEKAVEADIEDRFTASKPSRSKIELNQSYEQLEIKLPPRGIQFGHLPFIFACMMIFSIAGPIILSNPEVAIFFFIPGLLFLSIPLLTAFGRLDIRFNRNDFTLQRKLFGFTYKTKIEKTSTIHDVTRDESSTKVNGKHLLMVTVKCGVIKYSFGAFAPRLTSGEINWLIKEMKAWLAIK